MAELILSPIAAKIIGALGSAAVKEIALLWGVNDELEELEETISTIGGVLIDAEKQVHNNQVKNWLQRLRGVVHDADNLTDEFNTEALRRQVMSGHEMAKQVWTFFSSSNQLAFRLKMARRIKEIKKKLAAISNNRNFLLEVLHEEQRVRVDSHSYVAKEEVIGRDKDRLEIIKLLLEGETEFKETLSIIPIVGIGGLGKTTLAQSIFNDEEVQQYFELMIWVCVSDNFDLKLVIQNITKSATKSNNLGDIGMDQLQKDLRKELGGKRYLLVLDDVWEENREKWLKLKELIICGAYGSRVVVTTRSTKVADITFGAVPYQLGILNEEDSWSLFKKVAFKQGQELKSSKIEKIGMEIVNRCRGIPLAIKTIGNLLYGKNSESEWSSFNKEFSKISQETEDDILPTLKLSYDHLPSHLKQCFAYCRLFPKDYVIEVATLIKLWMAQGFLKLSDPGHDQCLEEMGYEYFINLLQGSFFQEAQVDKRGIINKCKMHDLMHDLAVQVAGAECASLGLHYEGNIYKHTRHVSFEFGISSTSQIPSFIQARKIQTILLLKQSSSLDVKVKESFCNAIISKFKFIRSFDLHCLKFVPNSIGKLKHLRYLDLSFIDDLKALPNSITNLQNLQTLKLNNCIKLQELPRDIQKLINLRHLEISGCRELNHMPRGLGQLKNLQTLSKYVLISKSTKPVPRHGGELKELMDLNSLRGKLEIENLCHGKDVAAEYERANLKEKQYLRSLKLVWDSDVEIDATESIVVGYEMSMKSLEPHPSLQKLTVVNYLGVKLSSWLPSLTNLVNLTLSKCEKCQYLVPSNQFPCLKYLKLDRLESLEYIFNSNGNNSFLHSILLPSLQQLELRDLPNLKGWWREFVDNPIVANEENRIMSLPYFTSLSKLEVLTCPKLTHMPLYPHLEEQLTLDNTSLKPFQETMMMSPTTSCFSPLSKLTTLHIAKIEDLECLPDWFKSLSSLNNLSIWDCPKLKDLCPGILHLSSLRSLRISNCEELAAETLNGEDDDHALMWKILNGTLQSLTLMIFPKVMTVFPKGIQHLTGLQRLAFSFCDSLTTIPEWIDNLQSLETLEFSECPNLTSLPEGIRSLTTLKTLAICFCPMLLKRCKRQIGEDWHKISHIQHLYLHPDPNKEDENLVKKTKTRNLFNKFGLCNIRARNQ